MFELFNFLDGLSFELYIAFFLAVLWLCAVWEVHSLRKEARKWETRFLAIVELFVRNDAERRIALARSRKLLIYHFNNNPEFSDETHLAVFWQGFSLAEETALLGEVPEIILSSRPQ